jgi:hypothetical protein
MDPGFRWGDGLGYFLRVHHFSRSHKKSFFPFFVMLSLSKHDKNVVRGFSPACRGGSCCHGKLVEPCTLRQAQGDSGDFYEFIISFRLFFPVRAESS